MSSKISALGALASTQADDVLPVVDVHDTTMAATGTTKKITVAALLAGAAALLNYRGQVQYATAYNPGDVVLYNGERIYITGAVTTGAGTNGLGQPFISAASYAALSSFGIYYAADYGVTADGGTDDWTALQSLLILLRSLTTNSFRGFRVILPAGTVAVSRPVIIPTSTMLEGQGLYSTAIKILAGANCDVVQPEQFNSASQAALLTPLQSGLTAGNLRNAFRWGLRNLTLHGNSTQQAPGTYKMCLNVATNPLTSTTGTDPDFDPAGLVENVQFRAATGDGFFHNGRSAARLIGCIAWNCSGNGFTPSFDTQLDHCQAGFSGIAGFYFNHNADQGAGCKSYNNGEAAQWVSGSSYAAGTRVMSGGLPYDAIGALTNDTTAPASDPANWAPVTATSPAAWGAGAYFDAGAGEITFDCDCQQNSACNWYFHGCTGAGISVSGVSAQPNFNQVTSLTNASNPGNYAHLCVDGSNGVLAALACGDTSGHTATQYRLRMINGSTRCDITLTGDTNATLLTPDSTALLGSGNSARYNGVNLTATLAGLNDVNVGSPGNGTVATWNAGTGKWIAVSPPSGNYDGAFGDGSDGLATLDGTATVTWATKSGSLYTMTRDCWLTGLTINSGVTLLPAGNRIFVQGNVTSNGTIRADGNSASGITVGQATPSSQLGGGVAGSAGQTGNGTNGSNGANATFGVGSGGAAGAGSAGTGGTAASAANGNPWMLRVPQILATSTISGKVLGGAPGGAGGGGDSANKGGGGGSGAGVIAIIAWTMTNNGLLSAAGGGGGTPPAGNCGGGGPGGGGLILVYTLAPWTNSGTTAVTPGTAGSGAGTGAAGGSGTSGNVLNVVIQAASGGSGAGVVTSITAGDASIAISGPALTPVIETGTLDQVANLHPPAADWSNNSRKITSIANGTSTQDAAAFGQLPVIDSTAGDIQPSPGTQAAGATGKAADAGHVHGQPPAFAPAGLTGATSASRYAGATASGAPVSGTFAVGDFAIDQSGKVWVCTAAGTPGTWSNAGSSSGVSSFNSRTGAVSPGNADYLAVASGGLTGATAATRFVGGTASGAPASGTFAVGDFAIDQTAKVWVCTTAGTPGTWTQATGGGSGMSNPMTTLGDIIYENATPAAARLPGSTSATKNFLTQTGTGTVSAAPAWGAIAAGDLPAGTTSTQGALQLDGTAADIQPTGIQAAGATGKAADAGHVHQGNAWLTLYGAPTGATAETFPRDLATAATASMLSGTLYVSLIPLPKGLTVNSLTVTTGTTAKTGGSHGWYVLLDSGLVVRAVTADQTDAATVWGVASTAYTLAFASPYTTPSAGLYYAGICVAATGMPTLMTTANLAAGTSVTPLLAASSSSALTTPPSTGTTEGALTAQIGKRFYAWTS